ncbi:hypothetical protein QFZ23_002234 [Arthrobacter globiformis]|uniref:hypothetical protein n=1 Tax=Arthrobacter globiformis TaxID=1665 RepID=UPI0027838238|nr:hypothetical protein [Arthrobacter globiformis]MDQ1058333.1 hypothetical protein [Arthrobacter globiformis]
MSAFEPTSPLARRASTNPADRDIDVDVFLETSGDHPDAELAAHSQRDRLTETLFRTPKAGEHLDAESLEEELEGSRHTTTGEYSCTPAGAPGGKTVPLSFLSGTSNNAFLALVATIPRLPRRTATICGHYEALLGRRLGSRRPRHAEGVIRVSKNFTLDVPCSLGFSC